MARCNTNEHINEDGNYEIHVNEDVENVSARIQSRHVSAKKYHCWIQYGEGVAQAWYCKCKAGYCVIGSCQAVPILPAWYGTSRMQDIKRRPCLACRTGPWI